VHADKRILSIKMELFLLPTLLAIGHRVWLHQPAGDGTMEASSYYTYYLTG